MIRYDAIDKDGISRVYGFGETNYEAYIQCEIALREKLIGKLERGCQEAFAHTSIYFIESETEYKKNNEEEKRKEEHGQ